MNWGMREHSAEGKTSFLLLVNVVVALVYWFTRSDWLIWILIVIAIVTFLIHLWARFAHMMEKRWYKSK